MGVTWLKWLPTGMESKTRLAPKSNKVNSQKLTLDWNTSLCYRVIWKWRQSAFHANNHAIGGGSNGIIIHLCLNPGFGLQLLSINFVGFGSQHGLRFHTSRQSFEPSYTQIQALLVFLWAYVAKLYPRRIGWTSLGGVAKDGLRFYPVQTYLNFPSGVQCRSFHLLFLPTASLKSWSAQGPLKWIVSGSTRVILSIK